MTAAAPRSGRLHHWEAEAYPPSPLPALAPRDGLAVGRVLVLCAGLGGTALAGAACWTWFEPPTLVQTRIVADGADLAGRAALAGASLRIGAAPNRSALLADGGNALVIAARNADPAAARMEVQSVADAVLNTAAPAEAVPAPLPATPPPAALPPPGAERTRLLAAADAIEARATAISASLTGLARDLAANARIAADRQPGRDTLDKAAAALADLQLQRIQLQSRYQDDYPAVLAVDGQIRTMRAFLLDETKRVEAARSPAANAGDATLTAERDRLRAELAQLVDRRAAVAADLAALARTPTAPATPSALPDPPPRAAAPPGPVLLEGAITVGTLPDHRWIALPLALGAGLCLTLLGWFWPRRLPATAAQDAALRQLALALQARPAALPAPGYPLLPGGLGFPLPEGTVLRQTQS